MDTWKKIGLWVLVTFAIFAFFKPLRSHFSKRLQVERQIKGVEREEQEILGKIYGYNPRVAEIQSMLRNKGFTPGRIDGRMGESTREAIKKFQEAISERPTGFLNKKTWFELAESKFVSLEEEGKQVEAKRASAKENLQTEIMEYRLRNHDRIKRAQVALKNAGFDPGTIDGKMGEKTKQAVVAFQKSKGLTPDGVVGTKTWEELSKYQMKP